jgi:hypothetical protein
LLYAVVITRLPNHHHHCNHHHYPHRMASPAQAFWRAKAVSKTAHEIKSTHLLERNVDKQARWQVRQNIVKDGVVSNLYDISIDPKAMAFYYDLDVTRRLKANVAVANAPANASTTDNRAPAAHHARKSLPVSPTRAWRMYSQSLRRYPSLPPLVRVNGRVYAANALPSDVLTLPPEFHDLAWERCCLRPAGSDRLASLPPSDLKSVVNKMLPWALSYHARNDGSFAVVRQVDGKMVCTEDGISVAGLRIFRGTTATILHVKNGDILSASEDLHPAPPSLFLGSIANDGETVKTEFPVRCVELLRTVVAQGKPVAVYLVEDSSGKTVFRLWNAAADTMKPGQVYTIATVKTKAIDPSLKTNGTLRFEIQGSLPHTRVTSVADGALAGGAAGETGGGAADASVGLALRLDTRCTVASEKSLWEEVRQHFGAGPYDADKQRMITRALQGTPVILSNSLKHTSVKSIRFDYVSSKDAPIDNELRGIDSQIDANQPYAVVNDFSVVPVQALHCCFDPRMRSWQEVTVPACSFMPLKRHDVLHKFRAALGNGLTQFGVHLAESPLGTKSLALLDAPTPRDSMAARPAATPGRWPALHRRFPRPQRQPQRRRAPPAIPHRRHRRHRPRPRIAGREGQVDPHGGGPRQVFPHAAPADGQQRGGSQALPRGDPLREQPPHRPRLRRHHRHPHPRQPCVHVALRGVLASRHPRRLRARRVR